MVHKHTTNAHINTIKPRDYITKSSRGVLRSSAMFTQVSAMTFTSKWADDDEFERGYYTGIIIDRRCCR